MNSIFESLQSSIALMSKGGLIMVPIAICSIIALTVIIERLYFFRKSTENPETIFKRTIDLLDKGDTKQALEDCRKTPGPISRLMASGLRQQSAPKWKLEETLTLVGQEEINKLGKNIRGLEVIATITPLMGLLGTVVGMVAAFNKVAEYKGQVDPSLLAGGIWEALLTTAAGLAVAIPAVVMLHHFDRRIEKTSFFLSKFGQLLVHHIDEGKQENASRNGNEKSIAHSDLAPISS
jgi:biopolymer transport protein ExbB